MPVICNNCGQQMPDDSVFCPKCGAKRETLYCAKCGRELLADADFCTYCGTRTYSQSEQPKEPVDQSRSTASDNTESGVYSKQDASEKENANRPLKPPESLEYSWRYFKLVISGKWTNVTASLQRDRILFVTTVGKKKSEQSIDYKTISAVKCTGRWSLLWSLLPALQLILIMVLLLGNYGIVSILIWLVAFAVTCWTDSVGIYHQELIITQNGNRVKLISRLKDKETLFQIQNELVKRAELSSASVTRKAGNPVKAVGAILGIVAVFVFGYILFEELYLTRAFPARILASDAAVEYIETQIRSDLGIDWNMPIEIASKGFDKDQTAMPLFENGKCIYLYVPCRYDVVVQNAAGDKARAEAVVSVSFEVKLFSDDILVIEADEINYSDNNIQTMLKNSATSVKDNSSQQSDNILPTSDYDDFSVFYESEEFSGLDGWEDYIGTWEDIYGYSCIMTIEPQRIDGYYAIQIGWWVGTQYYVSWTYNGQFSSNLGGIVCYDGSRADMEFGSSKGIYSETGSATIEFWGDGTLLWTNFTEDMSSEFPLIEDYLFMRA